MKMTALLLSLVTVSSKSCLLPQSWVIKIGCRSRNLWY
jgi:hypothetical protein